MAADHAGERLMLGYSKLLKTVRENSLFLPKQTRIRQERVFVIRSNWTAPLTNVTARLSLGGSTEYDPYATGSGCAIGSGVFFGQAILELGYSHTEKDPRPFQWAPSGAVQLIRGNGLILLECRFRADGNCCFSGRWSRGTWHGTIAPSGGNAIAGNEPTS